MISVIIPHLDQPEALSRCLESLCTHERPPQQNLAEPVEFIVVDNGSKVMPVDVCAGFPGVTLLRQHTPGPGPARNLGVLHATGDILAFIDADCIADQGWLSHIEQLFRRRADVAILGGDVRIACDVPTRPTLLEAYESVFAYRMKEYIAKQGFTGTGNLAVRAQTFALVGPFGGIDIAEDRDWGQRALRKGYTTHYCPDMIVYHPARRNFDELARKWERHIAHDFAQARSKPGWWPRWMVRSVAVALSPLAEAVRIGSSDRIQGWRARWLALAGVIMIRLYRSAIMLRVGFGANASRLSSRWNRA
ncbi:glycosyltransferase family 2 protein [Mesorhizobium loti]|uniref:glycosyltransferase family 2 protein n=1 Tax=Rhizobium loti TaxID=381 RepID=UPI00047E6EE2|nr:glycosyltransferase family 2 protein [Mesorhizobium loti]